jgi:hypothetical protein
MDCVGCDKCRLWGKLQTAGYGTALKVLFEFDNDSADIPILKRTELVALFNTYARLSGSLESIQKFRDMVEKKTNETETTTEGKAEPASAESDKLEEKRRETPSKPENETIKEMFDDEFARFTKAFKLVIKGWIKLPGVL